MTCGWGLTFYQNVSSLSLTVWERECFKDIFTKDDLFNKLLNDEVVCRTAQASPGLLGIFTDLVPRLILSNKLQCLFVCWSPPAQSRAPTAYLSRSI